MRSRCLLLLLAACAKPNEYVAPPPPAVTIAMPERRDVTVYAEFTGTTAPYKIVEIRARVKGFLTEIHYQPGRRVEKGALLFRIDPTEYEASVRAAEADLGSAQADVAAAAAAIRSREAALALAVTAVKKLERAYEARAVSEILLLEVQAQQMVAAAEVETAKAQRDVALARVGVAEARLERARLDLGWTTIRAPMGGYPAMWVVEVGSLVGAGDPTLLATMVNDEKIFCSIDVTERWVREMREALAQTLGRQAKAGDLVVEMGVSGEEGFPYRGRGDYVEPTVDPDTGTLRMRAIFDNPDRGIPGGAFARVRFPVARRVGALLVTERAVGEDQSGSFLLVVNEKNVVERRGVKLGARQGNQVVVLEGIEETDRIIVAGLQRVRPGVTVKPETAQGS